MTLTAFGTPMELPDLTGMGAPAKAHDGRSVVVHATREAIQDYGWQTIFDVASQKYDQGSFDASIEPPVIRVISSDCMRFGA